MINAPRGIYNDFGASSLFLTRYRNSPDNEAQLRTRNTLFSQSTPTHMRFEITPTILLDLESAVVHPPPRARYARPRSQGHKRSTRGVACMRRFPLTVTSGASEARAARRSCPQQISSWPLCKSLGQTCDVSVRARTQQV